MIQRIRKAQQHKQEQQQAEQQQKKMKMQKIQIEKAKEQATAAALQAQAAEANARAQKYQVEASLEQYNSETNRIKAASATIPPGDADDKEFGKRMKLAERTLKKQRQEADRAEKSARTAQTGKQVEEPSEGEAQMMARMQAPSTAPEESQE